MLLQHNNFRWYYDLYKVKWLNDLLSLTSMLSFLFQPSVAGSKSSNKEAEIWENTWEEAINSHWRKFGNLKCLLTCWDLLGRLENEQGDGTEGSLSWVVYILCSFLDSFSFAYYMYYTYSGNLYLILFYNQRRNIIIFKL